MRRVWPSLETMNSLQEVMEGAFQGLVEQELHGAIDILLAYT